MSLKAYLVATTLSLLLWGTAYYVLVASYRLAQHAGLLPEAMIRMALATLIG